MLSKDYIVGITDGEGSFTAYIRPPQKKHQAKSYRVECHYYLKLREDELTLLREIKRFFGCGRISFQKDQRVNHRSCYRFEISDLKNIVGVVIPFFRKNKLQSVSRKRDLKIFCQIVDLIKKKAHQNQRGLKKILNLKNKMHK